MDDAVRSEIAALLGMKSGEIKDVEEDKGDWVITTHDQTVTRIPAPRTLGKKPAGVVRRG